MPIKAVTIDFWNTLYDSSGGEGRDRERFAIMMQQTERLGAMSVSHHDLKAAHKAAWEHFNVVWKEQHRTPPTRSMVEFFWNHLAVDADEEAIETVTTAFCEGVLNHPPALLPGVAEVLAVLSTTHSIALISDTAFSPGRVLRKIMERDGIAQYFNAFSFSDETGVSKPHPKAFQTALAGLAGETFDVSGAFNVAECVHIGDIERTDVAGAKNIGMRAILFAGDPNARMNDEHKHLPTEADACAESWPDILRIIKSW